MFEKVTLATLLIISLTVMSYLGLALKASQSQNAILKDVIKDQDEQIIELTTQLKRAILLGEKSLDMVDECIESTGYSFKPKTRI